MLFSALLDDILLPILSDAFPTAADLTDRKRQLAVLSISQQVHQLMLPKIYRDVFIMCYFEDSPSNNNSVVKTNICLAAATGNFHFARMLDIKSLFQLRQLASLENAINVLTPHSGYLDHIIELKIAFKYDNKCNAGTLSNLDLADDFMVRTAQSFARLTLNVTRMRFDGDLRRQYARIFYSKLIEAYAGQLSQLTYYSPFDFPLSIMLSQITRLSIQLNVDNIDHLPRVCPDTIQYLRISDLPVGYTWKLFGYNTVPKAMTLPNIVEIDIQHVDCPAVDNQFDFEIARQCKVHTPCLRVLSLRGKSKIPLLNSIVLPQHMESIDINTKPPAILGLENTVLPRTKRLMLKINSDCVASPNLYTVVNSLFNSAQGYVKAMLKTHVSRPPISANTLQCTSLTFLMLHTALNPTALIGIITSLPNLVTLWVTQFRIYGMEELGINIPEPSVGSVLPPINLKLSRLVLLSYYTRLCNAEYENISKYLLLSLPSLKFATIENPLHLVLRRLDAEYGLLYPHLSRLRIDA